MTEISDGYQENQSFKAIQREARALGRWFDNIAKVKLSDPLVLARMRKAWQTLPDDEDFIQLYREFKSNVQGFIDNTQNHRAENIRRLTSAYIRGVKQDGRPVREFIEGWRIGPLELQINFDLAQISFLYNQEALTKWQSVGSVEDIQRAEKSALTLLEKAILPPELAPEVFWEAYVEARKRGSRSLDASLVPVNEFYRELRIALVRSRFASKKPNAKIDRFVDFPKYAFLYNLDLYRRQTPHIPAEIKLAWQTGSMSEVSKGKGVVINGLEPANEYKCICYVKQAQMGILK